MSNNEGIVAKRYATALFECYQTHDLEAANAALVQLAEIWEKQEELRDALFNPANPYLQRQEVLKQVCALVAPQDVMLSNFCLLLLDNRRLSALPAISEAFSKLLSALRKQLSLTITSAFSLDDEEKMAIAEAAQREGGSLVSVNWKESAELLGGVVVQVGDSVLDGSVQATLEQLRTALV